jgi:hypothetical protein
LIAAINFLRARGDLGGGELLQAVAQHGDVFAEFELQARNGQHADAPVDTRTMIA